MLDFLEKSKFDNKAQLNSLLITNKVKTLSILSLNQVHKHIQEVDKQKAA